MSKPEQPAFKPSDIIAVRKSGYTNFEKSNLDVYLRKCLPGIVIFVHGVNSDGEWYKESEQGLCAGLNERLQRCDEHMVCAPSEGGQLRPVSYLPELTADGFINPEMFLKSPIDGDDHYSPVVHFRWGYKASLEELQKYGDAIYLNENNYWGGGPFANGCSALPDLWSDGLSDNLFLWLHVQHLNPTNDRNIFSCPPRPYFVLAALRLARLVKSLREQQADMPITLVCHSQGNMIGMAAAFLGDRMARAVDEVGVEGRCVADSYVLCNAPFSLRTSNFTEDWSERHMKDRNGGTGRQTGAARIATLRAFFDIVRQPASRPQDDKFADELMANRRHGFAIVPDRARYGASAASYRRVTLYCNPHDKVISAATVQGIGWRGLSQQEIDATGGEGIFSQRVYAQGHAVGVKGRYHFWTHHYRQPSPGAQEYWQPESQKARYSLSKGLEANRGNFFGQVLTVALAPLMIVALEFSRIRVNAVPDKDWCIPLTAPDLPAPFTPQALRFGQASDQFDQHYDPHGQWRDAQRVRDADDPYAGDRKIGERSGQERDDSDAAKGDVASEASMRYEDHARLRMQARREGLAEKDKQVIGEDHPEQASAEYKAWRSEKIKTYLADNIDTHASDHSTIMSNGMHARKALAYDVAVGLCHIREEDLRKLRIAADWRCLKLLDEDDPHKPFQEYFEWGLFKRVAVATWANSPGSESGMPEKIVDQREHPAPRTLPTRGGHP